MCQGRDCDDSSMPRGDHDIEREPIPLLTAEKAALLRHQVLELEERVTRAGYRNGRERWVALIPMDLPAMLMAMDTMSATVSTQQGKLHDLVERERRAGKLFQAFTREAEVIVGEVMRGLSRYVISEPGEAPVHSCPVYLRIALWVQALHDFEQDLTALRASCQE
jgi:hypothetical protein